ncbi:MAG: hypothetical protein IJU48_02205 [Synergistaceae bacterium]|nr:hypothetical protein [Synergistaceae bacterium]
MIGSQREENVPVSLHLAESILANQAKEIELRKQAEENKKQSLKYDYDLAKQSLQVQLEDRREQRAHQKVLWKWFMWFGAFLILITSGFVCWALYLDKEAFLLEIIRILFYGGSGFCAGISLNKMKKNDSEPPQE